MVDRLHRAYCGSLTAEFFHVRTAEQQRWVVQQFEAPVPLEPAQRRAILHMLVKAGELPEGFNVIFFMLVKAGALIRECLCHPADASESRWAIMSLWESVCSWCVR